MTLSPNIILGNDYVTAYFADQIWPKTLKDHRKRWDEAAKLGDPTPRSRLGELSKIYFNVKPDAASGDSDAQRALCAHVASALGYPVYWQSPTEPQPATVAMVRGDDTYDVPGIAVIPEEDEPPVILVVESTEFTTDPSFLITSDAKPARLPNRYGDLEKTVSDIDDIPSLINFVFAMERPPRWILVVGGGAMALVDHKPWLDGKWLGANIDDVLSNNDGSKGGELDQLAGWFSTYGTIPEEDGTSLLDTAVDGSRRQAVGVSESLRDAVRSGVEAIANEVLFDRGDRRKLSVFGEKGGVTVDAADLARQSIRWMYRLVVLLYAEARPNIGILPTAADGVTLFDLYENGYGLERLRHMSRVELETESARNGTHMHESLNLLFQLVNEGHRRPDGVELTSDGEDSWTGVEFTPLNSRIFGKKSCPDIDNAQLRDHVLQKVIAGLCFTPDDKGKGLQAVSYANLEINQLGAVYEGLMAYTGFIALEDRHEVAARKKGERKNKDGFRRSADPSRGSWTIPVADRRRYPDEAFVTEKVDETDEVIPIVHVKGSFVFRLSGRDRARSASFYTPSVLTEFTVRHALEEWQANHADLTASDVLDISILEPALGSGAFANEACDQVSELYLRLREIETGLTVPVEDRAIELRKLRAHFAINKTYGVDLNDTGVELAEVSLWLNSMHPGLAAPPLSHRLRRGNSLIGCTRSTYSEKQVAEQPWKKASGDGPTPPTDRPLNENPLGTKGLGIHQFVLPGEGWGVAAKTGKTNPVRELAPDWCDTVWDWKKEIHKAPSKSQTLRAHRISDKIETVWAAAARDVEAHLNAQNRRIAVWNDPGVDLAAGDSTRFRASDGPYERLKLVMDAWCALWMWAPEHGTVLPSFDQWLDCVDYLSGEKRGDADGRLFGEHTRLKAASSEESGALFEAETSFDDATSIKEAMSRWPWLAKCRTIAAQHAFFHWELDYAPLFTEGGFSLQVGNPPWVRLDWDEPAALAEHDPWWGISDLKSVGGTKKESRRGVALEDPVVVATVVSEAAENNALSSILGSVTREPLLEGLRTNLYMNFIVGTFRRLTSTGTAGLLHPESHFVDPKAGPLRAATYHRLRRHWQHINEAQIFSDVHHSTEFGVNVYAGWSDQVGFDQAVNLLHPSIVDRSITHDGSGETPGIKHPTGEWDIRPHRDRITEVTSAVLSKWVRLFDERGTPANQSRLLRPLVVADLDALAVFASQPVRLSDEANHWTGGLNEKEQKDDGTFELHTRTPQKLSECVLQGPHIVNATPFAQQPDSAVYANNNWETLDLELLDERHIPRTNLRLKRGLTTPFSRFPFWNGRPNSNFVREVHREFVGSGSVRTLQSCILPEGPPIVGSLVAIARDRDLLTVELAGLFSSLPYDYLVKNAGVRHIKEYISDALPIPQFDPILHSALYLRTLRLNCVSAPYAKLWAESFDPNWDDDNFVAGEGTVALGVASGVWSPDTPLRLDWDRWLALCEIDAIAALLLGLSEEQLSQIYRSQFGVLRMYEHSMAFDANGRQVCRDHQAWSRRQQDFEHDLGALPAERGRGKTKLWDRVDAFRRGETGVNLGHLVPPFRRADRELAMRTAYRAFAVRSGKADGVSTGPLPKWEAWG